MNAGGPGGGIMVVDDTPENLRLLTDMLTENGFRARPALSGAAALKSAKSKVPDLILLDIKMPGMDGYAVCEALKADEATRRAPVIFVSAMDEVIDKVRAFEAGGVDYVAKPFQFDEILARINTHLTLRRMQEEAEARNQALRKEVAARKSAESALKTANNELEDRVRRRTAELAEANRRLQEALEAVRAASRAKSEFLANISHELRTPLNPIIGMTDLALAGDLDPKQREFLTDVRTSAEHLLGMIEDLIDLSRMEADGLEKNHAPFSPASLLESVCAQLSGDVGDKRLTISCVSGDAVPDAVIGDAGTVKKILMKLGDNAVKFTEAGDVLIFVSLEDADENGLRLRFTVQDTGAGMTPEELARIFRDFTQADGAATRRHGGIGLGMTMARRLAELSGGRIWGESQKGKGTSFHFTLNFEPYPDGE